MNRSRLLAISLLLVLSTATLIAQPSKLAGTSIEIKNSTFYLNGKQVNLPIAADELEKIVGKPDRSFEGVRKVSTWDAQGLIAYQKAGETAFIEIGVILDIKENAFEFSPRQKFSGSLMIDGARVTGASSLTSVNRTKSGPKFKPIPMVKILSEYTSGDLYLVMWQTEKARPIAAGKILQISIAIKQD